MSEPRPVVTNHCVGVKIGRSYGRISMAGETVTLIDPATGTKWYLEWHNFFGPQLLTKTGKPKDLPGSRSAFWPLLDRWTASGKLVRDDGVGVLAEASEAPESVTLTRQGEAR
jgi:hypothetical protein